MDWRKELEMKNVDKFFRHHPIGFSPLVHRQAAEQALAEVHQGGEG